MDGLTYMHLLVCTAMRTTVHPVMVQCWGAQFFLWDPPLPDNQTHVRCGLVASLNEMWGSGLSSDRT